MSETVAVNLSGVTGNVYAAPGVNTIYTNVPQNDSINLLVGAAVSAVQLTNPQYATDTTQGFHILQNIEVQGRSADYTVWSYFGAVTLANKVTGQFIQFQLTAPQPGANNSGVNVEFLDGSLAYTSNRSASGIWTTWITKGGDSTATWGTNSIAIPFTAATALDQVLLGPSGTNTVNQSYNSSDVTNWYAPPEADPSWFSSEYYLFSKQAELASHGVEMSIAEIQAQFTKDGYTPYTHYEAFSLLEQTDPNEYFSTTETLEAQAVASGLPETGYTVIKADLLKDGYTNAYAWWAEYGWTTGVNPSNNFNVEAYLEQKAIASGKTVAEI